MEFKCEDKRKLIYMYFLYKEGCDAPSFAKRIDGVQDENSMTARSYHQCINKFNNDAFYTGETERTGRQSLDIDDMIIEGLGNNKYATMAEYIGIGNETVRPHLMKLNKRYLCI